MSNVAGRASDRISLPKGGGALSGMGEKFSPDLFTGTGNYSVPIALPKGRSGLQPELSLSYSTGQGNGPFGLGFALSIPGVSRKTSKGVPRYRDGDDDLLRQDVFVLSGAEDLVQVSETEEEGGLVRRTSYRPRTEGLFARIERVRRPSAGKDHWEVRSKNGLTSTYGTEGAVTGTDPAAVTDPDDSGRVFAWKLTETRDPSENRITYHYDKVVVTTGARHYTQVYLSEIRYVDHGAAPGYLVSVKLVYQDLRPDPFSEHRAGFEIRTTRRCSRIEVYTHAGGAALLTRRYHLRYLDARVEALELPADRLPPNGVSLLSQVQVEGVDGDASQFLPPVEFDYTRFLPAERRFSPVKVPELPPGAFTQPTFELVDLFGNGLPDVLHMDGVVRYWRNRGDGTFDPPRFMKAAPAGLRLGDPGVQLLDADGDGRADLLVTRSGEAGYYSLGFDGQFSSRSFVPYQAAPSFDLKDPEVRLIDLDGDGVTDAVRSGPTSFECFFQRGRKGWSETRRVPRKALADFPNVSFSDPRVRFADMSGDGLQDVVLVHEGRVDYWPTLGHGRFGRRITMKTPPRLPFGYDPKRILLGDVDGDGLADVVYVGDRTVTLWLNQSGNAFSAPLVIHGTPPVSSLDSFRLCDLLGSGVQGVLFGATGLSQDHVYFLDFTGGIKPYLLSEMDNHSGALTRVQYRPSTYFYLEDRKRFATKWKTFLPFPVQVVATVEVLDELSLGKLTTEYRYHHGHWDGAEREFRGFGRVDHRDTEAFATYGAPGLHDAPFESVPAEHFSPPTETRTWFHVGPVGPELGAWREVGFTEEYFADDPPRLHRSEEQKAFLLTQPRRARRDAIRALRGSILRTELYALDGSPRQARPYTVTEHLQGVTEVLPRPAAGLPRFYFSHGLAERTTQWERGERAEAMTQLSFTGDYDAYGQPRSQIQIAVPRHRDHDDADAGAAEPYLATCAITDYAQRDDAGVYIVDRVARSRTYQIENDGKQTVWALKDTIGAGSGAGWHILAEALNYYDGAAFVGADFGQLGTRGLLTRTETLAFTEAQLAAGSNTAPPGATLTPEVPIFLTTDSAIAWTADYPSGFRALFGTGGPYETSRRAGYAFHGADAVFEGGYYVLSKRLKYDARGLVREDKDPLGRVTKIEYDDYDLLPDKVEDAAGLVTTAEHDYRTLQPRLITDPNGNRHEVAYTPLGLLDKEMSKGKETESLGDTADKPGTRYEYNLSVLPLSVRVIKRQHHAYDGNDRVPSGEADLTLESVVYSDGFGRVLQTRAQGEDVRFGDSTFGDAGLPAAQGGSAHFALGTARTGDDPAWVLVSGWQVYDNKGRVVKKYEPFFSAGWAFAAASDAQKGKAVTMVYDPRGHALRTVHPDGSEQWVVYGVPGSIASPNLATPESFEPTPWEAYTYDPNDNAGRTTAALGRGAVPAHHHDTPASIVIDALGRTVSATARNRADGGPVVEHVTRSTYDLQGNLLSVKDATDTLVYQANYDLAKRPWRVWQREAGIKRTVLDAAGSPLQLRDSKGALVLRAHDVLNRPTRLWARDDGAADVTLRERVVYADDAFVAEAVEGLTQADARERNLLGRPYRHYDEAGRLTFHRHDFKGNLIDKLRHVLGDTQIQGAFMGLPRGGAESWRVDAYRVDWEGHGADLLDGRDYQVSTQYDALNRAVTVVYPKDADDIRHELHPRYNRAGALEGVVRYKPTDGSTTEFVRHIAYSAKGQRLLIAYGNDVMTRYAYSGTTFRLLRLRSERYTFPLPAPHKYQPHVSGLVRQDLAYDYDLVGNILQIHDRSPDCGIGSPGESWRHQLDREFTYDPLYRLLTATGREHAPDMPFGGMPPEFQYGPPRGDDTSKTRGYKECYAYDMAGNMKRLRHHVPGVDADSFTRIFETESDRYCLRSMLVGVQGFAYTHDAAGNMTSETASRHCEWDHADRMKVFRVQATLAAEPDHTHYLYDSAGQRVKKLRRKTGGAVSTTVYIDGIFEHHVEGALDNTTLHVMDNASRIALIRTGDDLGDLSPPTQYILGDHLGSSNLVLSHDSGFHSREEFTPYGETSFGVYTRKRYQFTGKERDEESGLSYHGARYYAMWLGRWTSTDPAGMVDGANLYEYARSNPCRLFDPTGTKAEGRRLEAAIDQCVTWSRSPDVRQRADQLGYGQVPFSRWRLPEGSIRIYEHPSLSPALSKGLHSAVDRWNRILSAVGNPYHLEFVRDPAKANLWVAVGNKDLPEPESRWQETFDRSARVARATEASTLAYDPKTNTRIHFPQMQWTGNQFLSRSALVLLNPNGLPTSLNLKAERWSYTSWKQAPEASIRGVFLHELGHPIGLGDVGKRQESSVDSVMNYAVLDKKLRPTLGDVDAIPEVDEEMDFSTLYLTLCVENAKRSVQERRR